ncbi:MAG: SPASM domain-containing protein [Nitrospinae bacterium]|nr:SPASM domain-containing protein [Nitrospinota bacterium]
MNFPHHAHIEPTTYCNIRCENCINDTVTVERRGHLSISTLKDILKMMPFIRDISLLGLGEPLMNPEILDMLEFIKSKGIVCRIATNGMLLDKIDIMKLLTSIVQCIISFDAATKSKFEELRNGSDFDRIVKNIKGLVEIRNKNKIPIEISIHTVITKRNLKEVTDIPEIASELGVDKVRFVMAVQYTKGARGKGQGAGNNNLQAPIPDTSLLIHNLEIERELMKTLDDRCKRYNLGFSFTTSEKKFQACWWPNGGIYITYDGFVTPCCLRMDPLIYNFGNIFKDSIDVIFNGEKYQGFREGFREGRVPDVCANCPS